MCGPHPRCRRVIFVCWSEHTASPMLHSNEGVETRSSEAAIQPGFSILPGRKLLHQGKLDPRWCLCLRGRAENPTGSRIGSQHPAITEGSATVVCSATAYKAQRLWDTSACSATAALITAETLTVCHVSMLGPHFHSHYLQYPNISDIFLLGKRSVCIFVYRTFRGSWGGLSEYIINPKMVFFLWHIL